LIQVNDCDGACRQTEPCHVDENQTSPGALRCIAAPLCAGPAPAQATQADTYVRLMERLEALEQRVATLESTRMYTGPVRVAHRQPGFTRTSISLDPGQHLRSPQVQIAGRFKRS